MWQMNKLNVQIINFIFVFDIDETHNQVNYNLFELAFQSQEEFFE